jgi:hypothetical protein
MFFAVCDFAALRRAAICAARGVVSAAVSSSGGGIRGVSAPLCHSPIAVPRLILRGSLTPRMRVAVVRQNRAQSVPLSRAPLESYAGPCRLPSPMNTSDRFFPEAAFI